MFGCQNKVRGGFVQLLVSAAPMKRIIFIAQYSSSPSCFQSTRLIFTVWLSTKKPPPISFTFCWGNSPFKAPYCNVTTPEWFFALEEGPCACACRTVGGTAAGKAPLSSDSGFPTWVPGHSEDSPSPAGVDLFFPCEVYTFASLMFPEGAQHAPPGVFWLRINPPAQ